MKRRQLLKHLAASIPVVALAKHIQVADNLLNSNHEFMASGPFKLCWMQAKLRRLKNVADGLHLRWPSGIFNIGITPVTKFTI